MIITEDEFDSLPVKEQIQRIKDFNDELDAYSEAGCPVDMSLLYEKADKHNIYIPIH